MTPKPDFALIAHQERWERMASFLNRLRNPGSPLLSAGDVRELVPFVPPRVVTRIQARSTLPGKEVSGIYIDTFITPDDLTRDDRELMREKVLEAAGIAVRAGASVTALGGFTSIALGEDLDRLNREGGSAFTHGHTLTTALIVKGLEAAAGRHGLDPRQCRLLVVGSTGDLGWSVVRYFSGKVKELLLSARKPERLETQGRSLLSLGVPCRWSTETETLLPQAELVLFVTSVPEPTFLLDQCLPHAVICDAGYPKNTRGVRGTSLEQRIFSGGMGRVLGGFELTPDLTAAAYGFPIPGVGHGCLLEGILLALEGRPESFSTGRTGTLPERVEEIWQMARRHGIVLPPFFNEASVWEEKDTPGKERTLPRSSFSPGRPASPAMAL
jgi:predicted amino acid dehydrogenase